MHRYVLSVQLAWTGLFGNTAAEAEAVLERSAKADFSNPDGTVYICRNKNVRSTAREAFFAPLAAALKARQRKVEVLDDTTIPQGKTDVIGAVVGTASFHWGKSKSTILPGAICEHLTSFGAHFGTSGQTKLTSFLRFGAAGASGTVREPLAIHLKFPNPMIHAFYADGCNLAEAFYQSVHGPYQLLIVGDGLCQPFAKRPEFELDLPEQPWTTGVEVAPKGDHRFEYWLDGRRVGDGATYTLEPAALRPGVHDFRVVAIGKDRIGTRVDKRFSFSVGDVPEIAAKKETVTYGEPIELKGSGITEVRWGSKVVARNAKVPTQLVGPGKVRLMVTAGGATVPVEVLVKVRDPAVGTAQAEERLGLVGIINNERAVAVNALGPRATGLRLRDQLAGEKGVREITLRGAMLAPKRGAYQLNIDGTGTLSITLAARTLAQGESLSEQFHAAISLDAGWHELEIAYVPKGAIDLEMVVSGGNGGGAPKLGRILPPFSGLTFEAEDDGEIVVSFDKRPRKKVTALAVLPPRGGELAKGWSLDYRTGRVGRWKPVKGLQVVKVPMAARPKKGEKKQPIAVELRFEGVKARAFRIAPSEKHEVQSVVVTGLE